MIEVVALGVRATEAINSLERLNLFFSLRSFLFDNGLVLAQYVEDPDVLGQIQDAWNTFIESGQVWALLIGLFIGYLFRTFTS